MSYVLERHVRGSEPHRWAAVSDHATLGEAVEAGRRELDARRINWCVTRDGERAYSEPGWWPSAADCR